MNKKTSIKKTTYIGVMVALVFVGSLISFTIPVGIGTPTRVHLGNSFCLLSGLILGPVWGGFAAGAGSALLDLTNPAYTPSLPFTFIFKFLMAFVCGLIARKKGLQEMKSKDIIVGGVMGQIVYIILYLGKSFIKSRYIAGVPLEGVMPALATKAVASIVNAVIAVVISYFIYKVILAKRELKNDIYSIQ